MWKEITEERYSTQLHFMMPTAMTDWGFLAGRVEAAICGLRQNQWSVFRIDRAHHHQRVRFPENIRRSITANMGGSNRAEPTSRRQSRGGLWGAPSLVLKRFHGVEGGCAHPGGGSYSDGRRAT
jgi:hypothetical protein